MSYELYSLKNQICHELRTPLNAIRGFAELISLDSDSAEINSDYAKIILSSANELCSSLDKYLPFLLETLNAEDKHESLRFKKNKDIV